MLWAILTARHSPHTNVKHSKKKLGMNDVQILLMMPRSSHGFFLLSTNILNTPYLTIFVLEQAVGPGVLQTFSTCALHVKQ